MQTNKITNINFVGKIKLFMFISLALVIISVLSLSIRGLNLGIDFTGGTIIEVRQAESVTIAPNLQDIRDKLNNAGFDDFSVSNFGSSKDILINLEPSTDSGAIVSNKVLDLLGNDFTMRRVEFVGPKVGEELTNDGGLAMLYALIGILIYIAFRFEYRFGIGSVIALIHDVIITLGFFSITGMQFDLTVLAAILAIIGYSLNDTVVVFDRLRENFLNTRKNDNKIIVNDALNQTFARTLVTSITTLLVLIALFIFGGEIIKGFATALIIGVIIGTYSSIYVASNAVLLMGINKEHLLPSEREQQEIDNRP